MDRCCSEKPTIIQVFKYIINDHQPVSLFHRAHVKQFVVFVNTSAMRQITKHQIFGKTTNSNQKNKEHQTTNSCVVVVRLISQFIIIAAMKGAQFYKSTDI